MTSRGCSFFGRQRLPAADAQLGNNVAHIHEANIQFVLNGQSMREQTLSTDWRLYEETLHIVIGNQQSSWVLPLVLDGIASFTSCHPVWE